MKVVCPYCGSQVHVDPPDSTKTGWQFARESPREIECLPYTRDIGKFDGKGWSRIGKDFLALLSWERYGVLRIAPSDARILYCVGFCPECESPFDIFANYSNRSLSEIWPHLLRIVEDAPGDDNIAQYQEETFTERLLRRVNFLHNKFLTAVWAFLALASV